ncbi:hypothetical protein GCM10009846_26410 [Agrococcus versicolor]|uniref:RNA polymerase subunit sigma-70 n=1 Tax=Agrococcus versicolor TaxID=501482 RepID=A0ABN3AX23_9MICO
MGELIQMGHGAAELRERIALVAAEHEQKLLEAAQLDAERLALEDLLARILAEMADAARHPVGLDLYDWQREALDTWHQNERRGVIEAVTGAGKTRIGVAAAREAMAMARSVIVLVPTIELQGQWAVTLQQHLPTARIELLGGVQRPLEDADISVVVVHTAAQRKIRRRFRSALVIADECHRYASDTFQKALDRSAEWRLGLTATFARPDGLHCKVLDPYFGGVIFSLGYARALADGVIAPFDIHFVGVDLVGDDRAEYETLTSRIRRLQVALEQSIPARWSTFGEFMRLVEMAARDPRGGQLTAVARMFTKAISDRRRILADNPAKQELLVQLAPAVAAAKGALVFTNTRQTAVRAVELLEAEGLTATAVHSDRTRDERKEALEQFRAGVQQLLAAPRVLDEGIDVPEADLAIVLSANRSRRQMIQRLGRVVRVKPDGRHGRFVIVYAIGTVEDPEVGSGHEEYLAEITPHAAELDYWVAPDDVDALLEALGTVVVEAPLAEIVPIDAAPSAGGAVHGDERSEPWPDRDVEIVSIPMEEAGLPPVPLVGEAGPEPSIERSGEVREGADPERGDAAAGYLAVAATPNDRPEGWPLDWRDLSVLTSVTDDAIRDYLRSISRFRLLEAHEEVVLGTAISDGLAAGETSSAGMIRREVRALRARIALGREAEEILASCNLRLAVSLAKRMPQIGSSTFLDRVQDANVGLMAAVRKFDATKGFKFSTYATWWIRQSISRAAADNDRAIRLPVHMVEKVNQVRTVEARIESETGAIPTLSELAAALEWKEKDVIAVRRIITDGDAMTFDMPVGEDDDVALLVLLGTEDNVADWMEEETTTSAVAKSLEQLSPRDRQVMEMRFGMGEYDGYRHTLDQIGDAFGVTRERIRQIEGKMLTRLRRDEQLLSLGRELGFVNAQSVVEAVEMPSAIDAA